MFRHTTKKSPVPTALFLSSWAFCYFLPSMSLKGPARRFLPSFRGRCFPSGTQLPYDSNPVALGYVKRRTFLSTCSRLVGIGFESQPTPSPVSFQSSLHAMNNKWHTKNQVEIEREYKTNSSNVEEEDNEKNTRKLFQISLITCDIIRVHISSLIYANSETRKSVILMNLNDKVRRY
jgi:hypothetical protein